MKDKTSKILATVFNSNVDTFRDIKAREMISQFIKDNLIEDEEYDKLTYSVFVKDLKKSHWKSEQYFTKVFYEELDHAVELYSISNGAKHFLLDLIKYLKYELNLLVDDKMDIPLNQTELAKLLNINVKTVQRNMKELIEKRMIFDIQCGKEIFYIVNPYIMYKGKDINYAIPEIFIDLGYSNLKKSRKNRRNKITDSLKIKE